jgi:hypothetical protein
VAAASGQEEDDPLREAKAYNSSIYLMLAVPYLLLGGFGWFVYRGLKSNSEERSAPIALERSEPPPKQT